MKILITHGYLLRGTGSNLFVANLVRAWCQQGHAVALMCQDPDPISFDFVEKVYDFDESNTRTRLTMEQSTPFKGKCYCFRPHLHGFLPVYVFDEYAGFRVSTFPDSTPQEIENYVRYNRSAMEAIISQNPPDILQTNHLVMFPYITAQVNQNKRIPHFVTIHGSALNFTVNKDDRFIPYALKGLEPVTRIIVDSKHSREEMEYFLRKNNRKDLVERLDIIPAGVDISRFTLAGTNKKGMIKYFLRSFKDRIENGRNKQINTAVTHFLDDPTPAEVARKIREVRAQYNYRETDQDLNEKFDQIDWNNQKIVLFVGKYLWTKGLHLILLAAPRILKIYPDTQFIFAGFGPFREKAELMIQCLSADNPVVHFDTLATILDPEGQELPLLRDILDRDGTALTELAGRGPDLNEHILFTGILGHETLKYLLPAADVLTAPSVFPEAFGMVAYEAMACGVYPLVTYQSAFKEVWNEIKYITEEYDIPNRELHLESNVSEMLAKNIMAYFHFLNHAGPDNVKKFKQQLRKTVVEHYSWEGVAGRYLSQYKSSQSENKARTRAD